MIPIEGSLATYEKRAVDRVAARLSVQVLQDNRTVLREYSVNMSVGGIFLESKTLLQEGIPLALHFELPDSRYIHCHARVAWVNDPQRPSCESLPPGMGIQFVDLQLEDLEALREFVKNKLIFSVWE